MEAADYCIDLLGGHGLAVLTQMQTLTVNHISDLLCTHSSSGTGQAIDYCFFYLHIYKFRKFALIV